MSEKGKEAKKKTKKKNSIQKTAIKNEKVQSIKMRKQTLKFDQIVVNKKDFHASKQAIALDLVKTSKILVSEKSKHNENGFKHFIGYLYNDDVIRSLFILLPPMIGYIKYYENGGKKCDF